MSDVVRAGGREVASAVETFLRNDAAGELIAWAEAARAANELAGPLSKTRFVPKEYQDEPGNCTAAILYGAEVGLSPMASLQSIYVISGKPAMYARTLLAVALAAGHEVWTEHTDDRRAVVCGRRRGSDRIEKAEWTIGRAQTAGYTSNKKYSTDPTSMLLARAQAELCRRIAADALLGLAYSVEELEMEEAVGKPAKASVQRKTAVRPEPDLPPLDDEPQTPAAAEPPTTPDAPELPPDPTPAPPRASARPVAAAATTAAAGPSDEPPLDEGGVTPTGDRPGMITGPQLKMLHALLSKHGMGSAAQRDDALAFYEATVGRKVESSKSLTKGEATKVIDRLVELDDVHEAELVEDAHDSELPYEGR